MTKRGTISTDTILEDFFVRVHLNDAHVQHLMVLYAAGTKLPPLLISTDRNRLIDGRHRLAALKALGKKAVEVEWDEASNDGDLLIHALQANIGGALPPTNADVIHAMTQMLESGVTRSTIIKEFTNKWPPSVVRKYIDDAQSNISALRLTKAKAAVIEGEKTVGESALFYNVKLEALKTALAGKRKRKVGVGEFKAIITTTFRSRGGTIAQLMRKVQQKFEDGDLNWKNVDEILSHYERICGETVRSAQDWRKRIEAKSGKKSHVA